MDLIQPTAEGLFNLACIICNWLAGECVGMGCLAQGPGVLDLLLGAGLGLGVIGAGGIFAQGFTQGFVGGTLYQKATASRGDSVTEYIPGVSPIPEVGDIIYVPGMGASKVTRVDVAPDGSQVDIGTELGGIGYHVDPYTQVTTHDPLTGQEHTRLSSGE